MDEDAEVVRFSLLSLQCCVPREWTDERAEQFANRAHPTGIESPWRMRHQGDEALAGCDERVQCTKHEHRVHIMFDC